jgi:hypothetical protein
MTLAIFIVVAAGLALIFIFGFTVSRSLQVPRGPSFSPRLQPVDLEAFRNLADPAEDEYLRRRLPAAEFRQVQRQRLRAMKVYVQTAGRNATVLIRIGELAQTSTDTHTAEAARQLVDHALLLRRNAFVATCKIYFSMPWPSSGASVVPVVDGYARLNGSAMLVGRLQNPAAPVRISAT